MKTYFHAIQFTCWDSQILDVAVLLVFRKLLKEKNKNRVLDFSFDKTEPGKRTFYVYSELKTAFNISWLIRTIINDVVENNKHRIIVKYETYSLTDFINSKNHKFDIIKNEILTEGSVIAEFNEAFGLGSVCDKNLN